MSDNVYLAADALCGKVKSLWHRGLWPDDAPNTLIVRGMSSSATLSDCVSIVAWHAKKYEQQTGNDDYIVCDSYGACPWYRLTLVDWIANATAIVDGIEQEGKG